MRVVFLFFVLALNAITLRAQPAPEWHRVYTFDDSTIEMNTLLVTSISKDPPERKVPAAIICSGRSAG